MAGLGGSYASIARRRILLLGSLAMFSLVVSSSAHATESWPAKKQALATALAVAIKRYDIPGAAVGVWTRDGHWTAARGFADLGRRTPVRLSDEFGIRSITKSFTVTVILELVAEGRLRLDDKVAKYLAGVPNGHLITLRQLASMTSGLVDYSKNKAFFDKFSANFRYRWTDAELLSYSFSEKPEFDPGTQYSYSNTNTVLLGVIAAKVTGKPFDKIIEQRILSRLHLGDTHYLFGSTVPRPRALNYLYDEDSDSYFNLPVSFTSQGPAGALSKPERSAALGCGSRRWHVPAALPAATEVRRPAADERPRVRSVRPGHGRAQRLLGPYRLGPGLPGARDAPPQES